MIEFGLRGHDISQNGLEETCRIAAENNVTHLQLALAKTVSDVDFDEIGYTPDLSDSYKKTLNKYNISVSVLGCYIDPINKNPDIRNSQLKRFHNFINYARDFNATVIGTETGMCNNFTEDYNVLLNGLIPLVEYAEETGVTIGIEPVWCHTISSVDKTCQLLSDIGSDSVGIIFDPVNLITAENYKMQRDIISDMLDKLSDKIKIVHIKDFKIQNGKPVSALTGTGELDLAHLFYEIKNSPAGEQCSPLLLCNI